MASSAERSMEMVPPALLPCQLGRGEVVVWVGSFMAFSVCFVAWCVRTRCMSCAPFMLKASWGGCSLVLLLLVLPGYDCDIAALPLTKRLKLLLVVVLLVKPPHCDLRLNLDNTDTRAAVSSQYQGYPGTRTMVGLVPGPGYLGIGRSTPASLPRQDVCSKSLPGTRVPCVTALLVLVVLEDLPTPWLRLGAEGLSATCGFPSTPRASRASAMGHTWD
eukprot:1929981-Rhodomonas_salina.2